VEGGEDRCDHRSSHDVLVVPRRVLVEESADLPRQIVLIRAQEESHVITVVLVTLVLGLPVPHRESHRDDANGGRLHPLEFLGAGEVGSDNIRPSTRARPVDRSVERPHVVLGLGRVDQVVDRAGVVRFHVDAGPRRVLTVHPVGLDIVFAHDDVDQLRVERSSLHRLDEVVYV